MLTKSKLVSITVLIVLANFCCAQNKEQGKTNKIIVGDGCEGCEAVYESPVTLEQLNYIDTLPDFSAAGPKLIISGVVFKSDGVTPAPDVVIYVYHTDQNGYYSKKGDETGWGKRHGYIRKWLRTNEKGEYKFYTLRPAIYPTNDAPAHIHVIIKEPDKNEYWIDDYVFDDDKLVNEKFKNMVEDRGGSGIIGLTKQTDGTLTGTRNIILGKNIPNYHK